jgi:hypothetical protein
VTQQKPYSSNAVGNIILVSLINEEKLLREFQRLLVPLWPNNKQIRRMAKVNGKRQRAKGLGNLAA